MTWLTGICYCLAALIQPRSASCPRGWHANGIRPDGEFTCRLNPPSEVRPSHGHEPDEPIFAAPEFGSRLFCGDRIAIVLDDRHVACSRLRRSA